MFSGVEGIVSTSNSFPSLTDTGALVSSSSIINLTHAGDNVNALIQFNSTAAQGLMFGSTGTSVGLQVNATSWLLCSSNTAGQCQVPSTGIIGWSSSTAFAGAASDTNLTRDGAAGTMALKQTASTDALFRLYGANGGFWEHYSATELLTLSTGGATTDTAANLPPAGSIIHAVCCRVTTTITTATNWSVGDGTTAARFSAANATLTSGTTSVGLDHMSGAVTTLAAGPSQAAAAKVRITTTGTPGAGVIRITVFASRFVAPTS